MFAVCSTCTQEEVVGEIIVQSNDCVVGKERKFLAVRVVSHVPAAVFEVPVEIEVAVQIRHWLLEMVDDVPDVGVFILIVWCVQLIIKKLVVSRTRPRVRHFKFLQPIVHVGVIRVAASDFDITTAAACVLSIAGRSDADENFVLGSGKLMSH